MKETTSPRERIDYLQATYDLSENNAAALLLAELGYSHSGIANKLGVTQGTARKYLDRLEERIGEGVTESLPKSRRYATFPGDTPSEETRYAGDVIDYAPAFSEPELPRNKGLPLAEIDTELIG